jgi:hypothetical protein
VTRIAAPACWRWSALPLAAGVGLGLLSAPLVAAGWRLPPVSGEFSGGFAFRPDDAGPALAWSVALVPSADGGRRGELRISGEGARLEVALEADAAGEGRWQIREGAWDLGSWVPALAPWLGPLFSGLTGSGSLRLSGEGAIRGGALDGRAVLHVEDGRLDDPAHALRLAGLDLRTEFDVEARRSPPGQELRWRSGSYDALGLGPGLVRFALEEGALAVEAVELAVAGGTLSLAALRLPWSNGEFEVLARLQGLELKELQTFLPAVLRGARGRVDGEITVRRTAAGLQLGNGRLRLRAGETAELRFAPSPGLLSGSLPGAVLSLYPGLAKVERGEVPIQAEELEVRLTPGGDAEGRTASVHVRGGPVDPGLRAPLDLRVNVRGPLESIVSFGTNSRIRFGSPK